MRRIHRNEYPALDSILWDVKSKIIEHEVAFQLYEKRWKYIDPDQLTAQEKVLIQELIDTIGKGLFLTA